MAKQKKTAANARRSGSKPSDTIRQLLTEGLALQQKGHLAQAQARYEQVLRQHPKNFDALHLSGVIAYEAGNCEQAITLLDKAVAINPDYPFAHNNRGLVLQELGRLDEALASYDKAIALYPDYAEAYNNRGMALCRLKKYDAALPCYGEAIALKPDFAKAYHNRGLALNELRQFDAAMADYDKAIAINPNYARAYSKRGFTLFKLKQFDAAVESHNKAIALTPDNAEAYCDRGGLFQMLRQFDAAMEDYGKAIALDIGYAEAYQYRGTLFKALKQFDAALKDYDKAIALKPDYAEAHCEKGLLNLLMGDFANGWQEYEWRWKNPELGPLGLDRTLTEPLWLGKESIQGKTILLHAEQGLGDTLQFCRYASLVTQLGAQAILEVQPPLARLLCSLENGSQVIAEGDPLPAFDYQCPLLSLPLAFKTDLSSIPQSPKYLSSSDAKVLKWASRLGVPGKPRIGISWSGNPNYTNDSNRSIALADFISLLSDDYEYICLQKDIREADKALLETHPEIRNLSAELADFTDTAALCELMDIIISVDTSLAHLAGALGRPVWVLLPCIPDWRWLMDRTDSPWYPSATLYRQKEIGNWAEVLERVKADLRQAYSY